MKKMINKITLGVLIAAGFLFLGSCEREKLTTNNELEQSADQKKAEIIFNEIDNLVREVYQQDQLKGFYIDLVINHELLKGEMGVSNELVSLTESMIELSKKEIFSQQLTERLDEKTMESVVNIHNLNDLAQNLYSATQEQQEAHSVEFIAAIDRFIRHNNLSWTEKSCVNNCLIQNRYGSAWYYYYNSTIFCNKPHYSSWQRAACADGYIRSWCTQQCNQSGGGNNGGSSNSNCSQKVSTFYSDCSTAQGTVQKPTYGVFAYCNGRVIFSSTICGTQYRCCR